MFKTPFAAIAAVLLGLAALAAPASANSHCRSKGCAEALARATTVKVKTVYRTVYVQQVRDVTRVRNVYRDRVVHARPVRPAPQRVVAYAAHMAPHRIMNYGVVQHGMMHPHWIPNGVTHCNCGGYRQVAHYHPGYYPYR